MCKFLLNTLEDESPTKRLKLSHKSKAISDSPLHCPTVKFI